MAKNNDKQSWMTVARVPLRISFFGGGTDLPDFYRQEGGAVISSTIDLFTYVICRNNENGENQINFFNPCLLNRSKYNSSIRLIHSILKLVGVVGGINISTRTDGQLIGVGLGSSSALIVAILKILLGSSKSQNVGQLAENAWEIESQHFNKYVGKQDHYITTFGGLRIIYFHSDNSVTVENVQIKEETIKKLGNNLLLFNLGSIHSSVEQLSRIISGITSKLPVFRSLKSQVEIARGALIDGRLNDFGFMLHEAWILKRKLSPSVTNDAVDFIYNRAINAGAVGGKIVGAGGGGCLLLYCEPEKQESVRYVMKDYREVEFNLYNNGAEIIFSSNMKRISEMISPELKIRA